MRSRLLTVTALAALAALALGGCSSETDTLSDTEAAAAAAGDSSWPRTVEHGAGETEISAAPLRIVSVSPSITGSLLAIDAPLVGSAATTVSPLSDDKGFFTQWADAADEAGVEVVYGDLELDLDAVDLFEPDLIIGSVNGGDATLEAYDQLSEIAPTVLLDYGTVTWQELTTELGTITGLEEQAAATIAEYDDWVAAQAEKIMLPEQPVTAAVYMGADGVWAFGADSPQARLLTALGFTYEAAAEAFRSEQTGANGVDILSAENAASGLAGSRTLFLVAMGGGDPVSAFVGDPLLVNQPAVAADRVHSLGTESFRLDYFSAKNTTQLIVDTFSE
ncbi:Fe2+-enterobactin ABC transporter substrate-binding protein [Microbacterium saperdae]|uniref:Iron complex transport system substrate-binding protein n=1 Tax=Microbacterium saperdae TaxID=69368 RepID=A0A543BQF7_9MICO|nr:Fe2+-enterobactin ABC transporter substrate-binding protein [Microbacterium saperdae]TQL87043.1 iron complex transport system substrate-binding protein [Microbacterium saperdae]GGM43300.1 iron-enterobactin transporter periplasmic-binding protein [Microbacterium saperdae]